MMRLESDEKPIEEKLDLISLIWGEKAEHTRAEGEDGVVNRHRLTPTPSHVHRFASASQGV